MVKLIGIAVITLSVCSFFSCSSEVKVPEPIVDPVELAIDSLFDLIPIDSIGSYYQGNLSYGENFSVGTAEWLLSTERDTLTNISCNIKALNDSLTQVIKLDFLSRLDFPIQDSIASRSFYSKYGMSGRELDTEIIITDESVSRSRPYLAVRIREKDGIAD